ncbi:MAG: hypothetical protein HY547_07250 [Elusimicrobia bacterium]|nr:hypothetical protein [Elusimicrobiota bacterium]
MEQETFGNSESETKWEPRLRSGNDFYESISALQKYLRRGKELEAFSVGVDLCTSGYDGACWKRLCIIAVEDVGLANPSVVVLVNNLAQMWDRLKQKGNGKGKLPETNILALAVIAISRSPKNRVADDLAYFVELDRKEGKVPEISSYCLDGHTKRGRTKLIEQAKQEKRNWMELFNEEFYHGAARSNRPVEVELGENGTNWSKELVERLNCNYELYQAPISKEGKDDVAGL